LLAAFALLGLAASGAAAQATNADGVGLRAFLSADTVYVGEQVTYTLSVRIPTAVRQRLRRNPEFVPPEPRAMLAYDLPLSRVGEPGDDFEVHTFRRALFVLTPGRYALGAARLTYAIPQSNSFFSREDDRVLRAEPTGFVAIEPPLRDRPGDWAGAVGQWRASLRAEPATARVGDPFVLVLRVEGTGNATLLPRPPLRIAWADVVPQDERVTLDSTPALFRGAKEFTWLVTPREPGAQTVPALAYPTFNPATRRYERIATAPVTVSVRPGSLAEVPTATARGPAAEPPLPIRESLAGNTRVHLPWQVPLTWLALGAPLPWLLLRLKRGARRRRRPAEAALPRTTRSVLDAGLRARTGVEAADLTAPGALAAALRVEGVTPETAQAVERLRDDCDRQGFAPGVSRVEDALRTRALAVLAKVDAEARRRALLLLVALGTLGCVAGGSVDALQAFTEGRTAYAGGDFGRAQAAFARAAAAAPRDAAAWANLGTAAWQAGDTATAVLGWQRGLRLDPTDDALRSQLARVTAPQHEAARVWPVPPLPLVGLGLALWLLGWGVAAWRQGRAGRTTRTPLLPISLGIACIAFGAWQDRQLAARDLVVIREVGALRALPALGADPGATPLRGEVARVRERRGAWLRVELDGERGGWYPAERTSPLARD
jgi:tetratricopeptide (TPR) repeat protein